MMSIQRLFGVLVVLFGVLFVTACSSVPDFNSAKEEYQEIVDEILDGGLTISEYGVVDLPDEKAYLSDGGICIFVEYRQEKYGIYFFAVRGMQGDSRGYLYAINDANESEFIELASDRFIFRDMESIDNQWYSCKTFD